MKNQKIEQDLADEKSGEFSVDKKEIGEPEKIGEAPENKELSKDELEHQKVRQQLEAMDLDDSAKAQVSASASDLQSLDDNQKITKLLELVKSKGVIFAVKTAQKMNSPYLLDSLHDTLVKGGYYKEFLK